MTTIAPALRPGRWPRTPARLGATAGPRRRGWPGRWRRGERGRLRRPSCDLAEGAEPVDRARRTELGGAEPLHEVAAPAAAGLLERREDPVDRREAARLRSLTTAPRVTTPWRSSRRSAAGVGAAGRVGVALGEQGPPAGGLGRTGAQRAPPTAVVGRHPRRGPGGAWSGGRGGRERVRARSGARVSLPTRPDQARSHRASLSALSSVDADLLGELAEEARAAAGQGVEHGLVVDGARRAPWSGRVSGALSARCSETQPSEPGRDAVARPEHLAGGGELVEHGGLVVARRGRPAPATPGRGPGTAQPASCSTTVTTPSTPRSLPPTCCQARQEPGQRGRLDRLDLLAQPGQRPAPQRAQHLGVAPLRARTRRAGTRPRAPGPGRRAAGSVWRTTATPRPSRSATSAAGNGPCVRA